MKRYTRTVLAAALVLLVTSWAVYAHSGEDVKDWWTEMKEHHLAIHGDDFEAHHQSMHGDGWQEHVARCHNAMEDSDTTTAEHMM